jgi:hypothetical protein
MTSDHSPERDADQPGTYQIRIRGHLGRQWDDWFNGLTITLEKNGDTLLTGQVIDQAALHGILKKVRDLGMPLLSVNSVASRQAGQISTHSMTGNLNIYGFDTSLEEPKVVDGNESIKNQKS